MRICPVLTSRLLPPRAPFRRFYLAILSPLGFQAGAGKERQNKLGPFQIPRLLVCFLQGLRFKGSQWLSNALPSEVFSYCEPWNELQFVWCVV